MPVHRWRSVVLPAIVAAGLVASTWSAAASAQRERVVQPTADDGEYGRKFFDQLRKIFGQFRNSDLLRAFQEAGPIDCSSLVGNRGEWRQVAFFNENRALGDWYRTSIAEVRGDLTVFIFKGTCAQDRSPLQLTTKFPVAESIEAFSAGRIELDQLEINVNRPVSVVYDSRSEAYTFELPFMFLLDRQEGGNVYSLNPPRLADRDRYAREVTDQWDCKAVKADDVTYQFMICRTSLLPQDPVQRNQRRGSNFGSTGFFILSDGKEASSSVKLSFGGAGIAPNDTVTTSPSAPVAEGPRPRPLAQPRESGLDLAGSINGWVLPGFWSKLVDLEHAEFRLRFSPQTWTGKIASAQVLIGQRLSGPDALKSSDGADACIWKPGTANVDRLLGADAEGVGHFSLKALPRDPQTAASILFEIKSFTGVQLGALQCYFPRAESPSGISFDRWIETAGAHVTIEVRP